MEELARASPAALIPVMERLEESGSGPLHWVQPKLFRHGYELRDGDDTISSLQWASTFGSLVRVETAGEKWLIKRSGLFWRRGSVRREGDLADNATFDLGWFGKVHLQMSSGEKYRWARSKFLPPEWTFTDSSGFPVARFKIPAFTFKSQGTIEQSENASLHRADLPLLILTGWYLAIVIQRRRRRS